MPRRPASSLGRRLKHAALARAVVLAAGLARRLPPHWDAAAARLLTGLVRLAAPGLDRRLRANLKLVYGRPPAGLAEGVWIGLGRGFIEFARLATMTPEQLRRTAVCRGLGHWRRAVAGGRGAILLSGHLGNFELLGAILAARGVPLALLARLKDDDLTEAWADGLRRRCGAEVLPKTAIRAAVRRLACGVGVGLLADQAVSVGGVSAPFLGRPAATAPGPLLLARLSGAAILPVFIHRDPNGRPVVELQGPLARPAGGDAEADLRAGAALMNAVYSAAIAARPADWLWLHRRFKSPRAWRGVERSAESALAADGGPNMN